MFTGLLQNFVNDFSDFCIKYSFFPLTSALTTVYIFPDLFWKTVFFLTFWVDLPVQM